MKTNLYLEIVKILEENSKSIKDIVWIGTKEATIDIDRFIEAAKHTDYDNGFGERPEIDTDLILVGGDWWLSRDEYDGASLWIFNSLPKTPRMQKTKFDIVGDTLFGYMK